MLHFNKQLVHRNVYVMLATTCEGNVHVVLVTLRGKKLLCYRGNHVKKMEKKSVGNVYVLLDTK